MDPYYAAAAGGAVVALIVSIAVLIDAILDLRAVARLGLTNGRRAIAINAVRDEASRTVELAIIAGISWAAAELSALTVREIVPLDLVPRIGIVVVVALFAVDSIADLRFRINLRETYRARATAEAREADPESSPAMTEREERADGAAEASRERNLRTATVLHDDPSTRSRPDGDPHT